ncbi:hypothetical protein CCACVL1_12366 [Corchorus capsularis]|uniref:Uncharacterized protein n=1 Tax=Corchorus capsularis TaxID=210143 RepID=A0A1R3IG38_COCAP|nr:hypothetical protein CCACVL1_12366 [Corchorus capsularis]
MGAYQYVVGDLLQVTLSPGTVRYEKLIMEGKRSEDASSSIAGDVEEKRIRRNRVCISIPQKSKGKT